ncbi:MAG: TusE/DsrC/DsvC family sulfur relay protein, partial [bacterium]
MALETLNVGMDAEGYLVDYKTWDEELAKKIAEEEGIFELTDRHWDVINYMRNEYAEKGDAP